MMKNVLFTMLLMFLLLMSSSGYASTIQLPKTGQSSCYDTAGKSITCAGTGQDGDIKAGVAWPDPRFVDNADGTVTDNLTGLVWLKNADCFGAQNWQEALNSANTLASGMCNLTDDSLAGEWRLPNAIELKSLVDLEQSSPAIPQASLLGAVPMVPYWMSSTDVSFSNYAWTMDMNDGYLNSHVKTESIPHVLPVRDSKSASTPLSPVQLPRTGQKNCWDSNGNPLDCAGTGQDADKLKGALWPVPRFSDNGNGTVTDNLTGLVWLKDAGCIGIKNWQDALNSANTLANGACSLTDGSVAGDWYLPNQKELQSLIDYQEALPALPAAHPFSNVQFSDVDYIFYWSSSSADIASGEVWFVDMYDGTVDYDPKTDEQYVWPVRRAPNMAPVIAEGESVTVSMSKNNTPTAFSLTLNASDADNDTITWSVSGNASHGTAAAAGSGTSVMVSYSPTAGYVGQDSFIVQVSDGKGGLDSITVNVTVNQTYLVGTSVTGNGSITPSALQTFNSGSSTTYAIQAGTNSYIAGVSGCGGTLSGNSYATGLITGDCTVAADFKLTQVKVPGNSVRSDYNTLQEAYNNPDTLNGMIIRAQAVVFDSLTLNREIGVTLKGGYDSAFLTNTGMTKVSPPFIIQNGSTVVENLTIL